MEMSADIFGGHGEEGGAKARVVAKYPTMHRTAPASQNYPNTNEQCGSRKLCYKVKGQFLYDSQHH